MKSFVEYESRGALVDWTTQLWVQATGRPLPNGSANVIMRPESAPDGSFTVRSSGRSFGDHGQGQGWSRYLKALKEDIRVYIDPWGHLRADHDLQIWGATFLRLHYRIRRSVT